MSNTPGDKRVGHLAVRMGFMVAASAMCGATLAPSHRIYSTVAQMLGARRKGVDCCQKCIDVGTARKKTARPTGFTVGRGIVTK